MQKVVELIEKHVQWLALGLGAVWLLLMTWTYVINPPAEVEIGSATLTAGAVDEYTVDNAVRPLEEAMKPRQAPPMPVDNFASRWLQRMSWENAEPIQIADLLRSQPLIPDQILERRTAVAGNPPINPNAPRNGLVPPAVAGMRQIATLPTPAPTPDVSDWRFGRSTIVQPPPVVPFGQPQPMAAAPTEVDKDWITQSFKVSLPEINTLFRKHQVPEAPVGMTAFLKVEMVRQELLDQGQWGVETIVQPLPPLNPTQIRQPYPAPQAGIHQETAYLNWAVQNTGDIVQPAFYQTVQDKGDMWERPGEPVETLLSGVFQPAQFAVGPIPPELNPAQRKMVMDYRREQAALRKQQERQNRQPRTPRGPRVPEGDPGMMMEGTFAPLDSDRPRFLQVRPNPRRGAYPPGYDPSIMMEDPAMMMGEDMMMMEGMQPQQQIMGVGVPDVDYPAGLFDPATWHLPPPTVFGAPPPVNPRPEEISLWAHDDTVQPGKTYRYRARYFLKNPVYQQVAAVKDAAAAKQFAIASEFSEWGPAIEIPALTNFFIANANMHQGNIRFDVYNWNKGVQHYTSVTVGPGDVIAASVDGIDFTTGHTVVDLRTDLKSRDPLVILASADGDAVVRTARGDRDHPINKKLKEVVEAAAAKEQQAAAGGLPMR